MSDSSVASQGTLKSVVVSGGTAQSKIDGLWTSAFVGICIDTLFLAYSYHKFNRLARASPLCLQIVGHRN